MKDDYKNNQYPIVLGLHGNGKKGSDNQIQKEQPCIKYWVDNQDTYPCLVLAPQCPVSDLWVDNNQKWKACTPDKWTVDTRDETMAMAAAFAALQKVVAEYNIDKSRIYVVGFSMGGWGTFDVITRHPGYFAGAIPISGAGDMTKGAVLKNTPIRAICGIQDGTIPCSCSEGMINAIVDAGGRQATLHVHSAGHNDAFFADASKFEEDPQAPQWLFQQRLGNVLVRRDMVAATGLILTTESPYCP